MFFLHGAPVLGGMVSGAFALHEGLLSQTSDPMVALVMSLAIGVVLMILSIGVHSIFGRKGGLPLTY